MSDTSDLLLRLTIGVAVPLLIADLKRIGGPTEYNMEQVRSYSHILGAEGDTILYKSNKKGQTARNTNILCEALAVLSFCPGGVTFAGLHFEEKVATVGQSDHQKEKE